MAPTLFNTCDAIIADIVLIVIVVIVIIVITIWMLWMINGSHFVGHLGQGAFRAKLERAGKNNLLAQILRDCTVVVLKPGPNEYPRVLDYSIFKSVLAPYSKNFSTRPFLSESFKYPIRWARASGLLDFKVLIRAYFAKCFLLGMLFLFWINEQYCCLKNVMYFKQSV